jgi:hypothetical protein
MTAKDMRKRLDAVTEQLDEERAKTAKLIDVIADMMKAAAGGDAPLWQPLTVPVPLPRPPTQPRIPDVFVAYACSFPASDQQQAGTYTSISVTSDPPKGNEP